MSYFEQVMNIAKEHEKKATEMYRAAMLQVMSGTILDTPVLDGYLRGAWLVGIGGQARTTVTAPDKTGSVTLTRVAQAVKDATLDTNVWFSNSLPYAQRVEFDGWSHTKAPEGMLRRNLTKWDDYFREWR